MLNMYEPLKNILLSEKSQMQKTTYSVIPFIYNIHNRQICRRQANRWLPGTREEGAGSISKLFYFEVMLSQVYQKGNTITYCDDYN